MADGPIGFLTRKSCLTKFDSSGGFGNHNLVCPLWSDLLTPAAATVCQESLPQSLSFERLKTKKAH